jgi:ketosteroid isomerase-like protein
MNLEVTTLSFEDAKVYGDLGFTRCNYRLDATPKAGEEVDYAPPDGKALTLYERQSDGAWKMVYDCYNSSPSPT